jgi:protein-disulfide isomerase-like protein with CxxC motif
MYALVALGEIDRSLEARFLHEVQIARYVHARDTSLPAEVATVAIAVASKASVCLDADQFAQSLKGKPSYRDQHSLDEAPVRGGRSGSGHDHRWRGPDHPGLDYL